MDFVAIDFETAKKKRSSPCSLGITVIKDNKIVEERYWLIRPLENRFAPINIMVHGLRPGDVENEPEFDVLWPEIKPYLEHQLVIAHNAAFDFSVLRNTLDLYQIEYPNLTYVCTMNMSRHYYSFLENAKLNTINNFLGYDFAHHHASADATACANILLSIAKELKTDSIETIAKETGVTIGSLYPSGYTRCSTTKTYRISHRSFLPRQPKKILTSDYFEGKGLLACRRLK